MLGWVALGAEEIVLVKGRFESWGFELQRVHCICIPPLHHSEQLIDHRVDRENIAASSSSVVSEVEVNNSEVDDALPEYLSDSDNSDVEMGVDDEFREEQCDEEADD